MKKKEEIINKIVREANNSELLFKQYKLFVKMSDHISERREKTNKFYSTLLASLFGATFLSVKFIYPYVFLIFPLPLFVFKLSDNWIKHIKNYKTLNKAKFDVINHLENFLPAKGYNQEWELCELYDYTRLTNNDVENAKLFKNFSKLFILLIVIFQIIIIFD